MDDEARVPSTRCSNDGGGGGGGGGGGVGLIRRGVSLIDNVEPLPTHEYAHDSHAQAQAQQSQPPPPPTPPPPPEQQQKHIDTEQTWKPLHKPRLQQPQSHGAAEAAPAVGGIGALRLVTPSDAQMRHMPSLFGSDAPSPRAIGGSGAGSIDPALRETMKAAIVDAKDLRDELKAAEARLSIKPTGIRPRDLMLPVFVLTLLTLPIVAVILPVFLKAGADKEILADGKLYACAISEIPYQVSAAAGSQNRLNNLPFDAITYTKTRRPKNTASKVVRDYLARHKKQCELIARLAFADQPVNWPELEDWSEAAKAFSSKFGLNMPPPYPPPPPSPSLDSPDEDDYSNYLNYYNAYSYKDDGGYSYDYDYSDAAPPYPPSSPGSPPPFLPRAGRRMLKSSEEDDAQDSLAGLGAAAAGRAVGSAAITAGEHLDDVEAAAEDLDEAYGFEEDFEFGELSRVNRRKLLQAKKLSAKSRYAIFQQLAQRNVSGYAGYLLISSELARLDPTSTTAVFSMTIAAKSDQPYPYGVVNQRRVSLEIPTNVSLGINVLSAESGRIELKPGDVSASKRVNIDTQVLNSLYYYPFDSYKVVIRIDSTLSNGVISWQMPVLVQQVTSGVGWQTTMVDSVSPSDAFINAKGGNSDASSYLVYTMTIERTWFVKFFAVIVLIFMWLLASFATIYGIDGLYLRPRNMRIDDVALFSALLFSMTGIREVMPQVPPVGSGVDFFGFIWIMLMLMLVSVLVLCRLTGQYVHPQPTSWDRLFNREYCESFDLHAERKADFETRMEAKEMAREERRLAGRLERLQSKRSFTGKSFADSGASMRQ